MTKLKGLNEAMDHLVKQCKVGEINKSDLQTGAAIIQELDAILGVTREECEKINEQHDKEAVQATAANVEEKVQAAQPTQAVTSSRTSEGSFNSELNEFVDEEAYSTYQSLQQHLQSFENSYKNLQKDDRFKKLKF